MRDMHGSGAEKLAMFEKVRAAGGFAKEDPAISRRRRRCCGDLRPWRRGLGERVRRPEAVA
jgi:hypothetical protein